MKSYDEFRKKFGTKVVLLITALTFCFTACKDAPASITEEKQPAKYTITIESGIEYGSVTVDKTEAEEGATITITATPAENYELDSISVKDASGNAVTVTDGKFTMPNSNVLVSAAFKAKQSSGQEQPPVTESFTVTLDADNGSTAATQTVEKDKKATKPVDPVKEGYTFGGWYNGETAFNFDTAITASITLKAKWTAISYTITYNGITGATNPNTAATYTIESNDITLADAIKEGFTFDGWFDAETGGNKVTKIAKGSTGNKVFYARWTEVSSNPGTGDETGTGTGDETGTGTGEGTGTGTGDTPGTGDDPGTGDNPSSGDDPGTGDNPSSGDDPATNPEESATASVTVTVAANATIAVTKAVSADNATITLTASEGFTGYAWLIDGAAASGVTGASISADGKTLTLTAANLKANAVYQITLSATKNGLVYGAQISVKK